MKIKLVFIGISAIFVILNVILTNRLGLVASKFEESQFLYQSLKDQLISKNREISYLNDWKEAELLINNQKLSKKMILIDSQNSEHQLESILPREGRAIIFRYKESSCNLCFDKYFSRINEVAEKLGQKAVYIFISGEKIDSYETRYNTQNITTYLLRENLQLDFEQSNQPYIFTIDSKAITGNGFIPNAEYLDYINDYISDIQNNNP